MTKESFKSESNHKTAGGNFRRPEGISSTELAYKAGVTDAQVRQMRLEGLLPKPLARGVNAELPCAWAFVVYWREKFKEISKRSDSTERMKAAEASMKELELAERMKTLCLREDYINNYADALTQMRDNIMRMTALSREQKEAVFAAIRNVKLANLEE